jgi:hypothetical protein
MFAFELLLKASKFLPVKKITCCFPDIKRSSKFFFFSEKCLPRTIQDNQPGMGQKADRHHLWNVSGKNMFLIVVNLLSNELVLVVTIFEM